MTLSLEDRRALLLAERTRNPQVIIAAIHLVLPRATLLEIEMLFRNAGTQTYVLAGDEDGFDVAIGMKAMLQQLDALHSNPAQNRAALSGARA